MHWCMDETLALMAMIPFIGIIFAKIHNWWHAKFGHKCHEESCQETHAEHEGLEIKDNLTCTIDTLWDAGNYDHDLYDLISKEDLDERLGPITDKLFYKLQFDLDEFLKKEDFRWFINGHSRVRATFRGRTFLHDEFAMWSEIKNDSC